MEPEHELEEQPERIDLMEEFIKCDEKPREFRSSDFAVMVYLMTMADENSTCFLTQKKISMCAGGGFTNWKAISAAIDRLHKWGWITYKRARTRGERETYIIHWEKIPPHYQGSTPPSPGKEIANE